MSQSGRCCSRSCAGGWSSRDTFPTSRSTRAWQERARRFPLSAPLPPRGSGHSVTHHSCARWGAAGRGWAAGTAPAVRVPRPRCAGWAPGAPGARARPRRPPAPRAPSWARLGALRKQRGSGHSLHRQTLHTLLCLHLWALGSSFARKIQLWNYGHYLLISHKIWSGNGFRRQFPEKQESFSAHADRNVTQLTPMMDVQKLPCPTLCPTCTTSLFSISFSYGMLN